MKNRQSETVQTDMAEIVPVLVQPRGLRSLAGLEGKGLQDGSRVRPRTQIDSGVDALHLRDETLQIGRGGRGHLSRFYTGLV